MGNFKQITLIITETCNLNCTYCYEKHKENSYMTFETARTIIDKECEGMLDDDYIQIEFFGGEPFLNFKLIKEVVEYVNVKYQKRVGYNTTTNGTLLTDEMKRWLKEHSDNFYAALSLDGTKSMHNANRIFKDEKTGSYDCIDIDFFLETYKPAKVKMTISPNILMSMTEGIVELLEKGFEVDATLALGTVDWSERNNVKTFIEQLQLIIDYYNVHPEYEIVRMLRVPVEAIWSEDKDNIRYCGAGKNIHCYTGNDLEWTPCQGFSRVTIGKEYSQYIGETFENYVEPEGVCKKCKVSKLCSKCWGTNLAATGNLDTIDPWLCVINRLIMVAGSKIQFNLIMKKEHLDENDQRKLKAIQYILENTFKDNNIYLKEWIM